MTPPRPPRRPASGSRINPQPGVQSLPQLDLEALAGIRRCLWCRILNPLIIAHECQACGGLNP